jgi:hypothetical protein
MRFVSPSACPRSPQQLRWPGLPHPTACVLRFSRPPDAFDPPRACRPCFMPDPLMGFRPSELCSCRVAVRRLRRRSPPDVGPRSLPSRPPTSRPPPKWQGLDRRSLTPAPPASARRRPPAPEPPPTAGHRSGRPLAVRPSALRRSTPFPGAGPSASRRSTTFPGARPSALRRSASLPGVPAAPPGSEEPFVATASTRLAGAGTPMRPDARRPARRRPEGLRLARLMPAPSARRSPGRTHRPPLRLPKDAAGSNGAARRSPEAEAPGGPRERWRWPRELPRLQGFDPRGNPPHTYRRFRPARSA